MAPLKGGVSEINITPLEPLVMSGYGGRTDPFKGIHDSLYARALYLENGINQALIITADLIGFSGKNVEHLKERIGRRTRMEDDQIFITATHNHGGPANGTYGTELPEEVGSYMETLHQKLVLVSENAVADAEPVKIGMASGECLMNINRRAVGIETNKPAILWDIDLLGKLAL